MLVLLAQGFAARNLAVDLVLVRAKGPNLNDVPQNVRVVDLDCAHSRLAIWKLVTYFRRERPRAMLSALDGPNVIAILAKWMAGVNCRLIISLTSYLSLVYKPENADAYTSSIYARLNFAALKLLYRFADGLVAISSGVADDCAALANIARARIQVLYLPVITPTLHALSREPINHPWFHAGGPPVIMAVGRLTTAKDYPTLIKAFCILRRKRPARLLIFGEGECRPALEQLVQELGLTNDVSIPGYVENQFAFMSRASVFALASGWEGLSMGLVEALACGAKVVSTDCLSGPREILEDGKWGRLVPVGDAQALAQALDDTLTDAAPRLSADSLKRFSLGEVVDKYAHALLGPIHPPAARD